MTAPPPPSVHIDAIAERLRIAALAIERTALSEAPAVALAAQLCVAALGSGHKVLACGNGGSASDAEHLVGELLGRYLRERPGLPAIALTANPSATTAIANDFGFDQVFRRQLESLGQPGDVLVAISTSGSSPNVVEALRAAREIGIATILLTGRRSDAALDLADVAVRVPSGRTPQIQEAHIAAIHAICDAVDHAWELPAVSPPSVIDNLDELLEARAGWKRDGLTVVWTNGCYDLLHVGHVRMLAGAKALGHVLVVGLNGDGSVRELKGPGRPLVAEQERAEILAAQRSVDHVVIFDDLTPSAILDRVRPDVHVKGADYADGRLPMPEADVVRAYGGRVEFVELTPERSTSRLATQLNTGHSAR